MSGTVFEVTDAELAAADQYEEPAAYTRIDAMLASGKHAGVYLHARSAPGRQLWTLAVVLSLIATAHAPRSYERFPIGSVFFPMRIYEQGGMSDQTDILQGTLDPGVNLVLQRI